MVTITQLFVLPQGQQNKTRPNGTAHVTCGYVGDNRCAMPLALFKLFITDQTGIGVPCAMAAPDIGLPRAALDPNDLYLTVQWRYGRTFREKFLTGLHTLACPHAT